MKPKITGIVVEYNPLHNGHIHHINEARKITNCDVLIAVMSPNFVQRGEPAFLNKWDRVEAALNAGVDLVIELPTYYALQSADYFAMAAVELLSLANIDALVFGVEDLNFKPSTFDKSLMNQGASYAAASKSDQPNIILAEAYEKQLVDKEIEAIRIQRTNGYHDLDTHHVISSASAIRNAYFKDQSYTHTSPMTFEAKQTHRFDDYLPYIRYALMSQDKSTMNNINLMSEGIENLLYKNRNTDLIEKSINKRYTRSRIQRTLLNLLLNFKKDDPASLTQFRVLGMNKTGQKHLATLNTEIYTTQFKKYINKEMELRATEIYTLPYSIQYQEDCVSNEIKKLIIK